MTTPPGDTARSGGGSLARLHLRTGLLRLARAELEELAGDGRLAPDEVLDLAEARWRTGDLRGASDAAAAWLDAGAPETGAPESGAPEAGAPVGGDGEVEAAGGWRASGRARALAHGLVAEGLTVRGRHEDAAVHVAAALDALRGGLVTGPPSRPGARVAGGRVPTASLEPALDAMFAGIPPRAGAWPVFELGGPADEAIPGPSRERPAPRVAASVTGDPAPDPIVAADERLRAGDDAAAAVLLMLALRSAPARASDVLERVDAALASRSDAAMLLARAEALRSLGRHEAAAIAYAVADTHARGTATDAVPAPPGPGAADPGAPSVRSRRPRR